MKTSKMLRITTITMLMLLFVAAGSVFAQQKQPGGWKANMPAKYKTMKGKGDVAAGKELYIKHCKSCHGPKGLGDGPKAASMKTFPGDFSGSKFQSYSDGELYYITVIGYEEMPAYE